MLSPIFEAEFSDHSYGYRPQRSAHDAVRAASRYVMEGKTWVVDIDISAFFDEVNHDILMAKVSRKIRDKRVLNLKNAVEPHKSRSSEPLEGLNGIYVVHPTGECEETSSCFDWAQHERVSSRPTDFFRLKLIGSYHQRQASVSVGDWRMARCHLLQTLLNNARLKRWGLWVPSDLVTS